MERPFALASVTKLFTGLAVLVAVEEETLSLDLPAGPAGSTVAHLLAHASGLGPERADGVLSAPGTRRIYSNAGYEIVAEALAEAAGMTFADYFRAAVLEPLDLRATRLDGSPAHGITSTLVDVARVAAELRAPHVLAPSTAATARTPFLPRLDGVLPGFGHQSPNPWGLGPEVRGHKRPHWTGSQNSPGTFGHFGQRGSFVWVDPVANVSLVCLTDRPFGPWAADAWPRLSDSVLTSTGPDRDSQFSPLTTERAQVEHCACRHRDRHESR